MKIVHTSDWHLGRSFGPVSLRRDQEAWCDWLVELVTDEGVDLVVIAGDLYDRAIAPNEAIELFRDTLRRLRATGAVVAAITGNHDGADRVAPYHDLLDLGGFYLRGGYTGLGEVITHPFPDGPLDLALIPYLDPQAGPDELLALERDGEAGEPVDDGDLEHTLAARRRATHQSVLGIAARRARSRCRSPRSLAVAHAFVIGGSSSESERQLEVGGTGAVDASLFEGFDYTALGHLHRPQRIGDRLHYSGTPLAYSFSEDHDKSVILLEMSPDGATSLERIPVPVGRRVTTITGELETLLAPRSHPDAVDRFVRAIVTDRGTVLDAKARLEAVYPWVVEVRLRPASSDEIVQGPTVSSTELSPLDATVQFWSAVEGSEPDIALTEILTEAVEAATTGVER